MSQRMGVTSTGFRSSIDMASALALGAAEPLRLHTLRMQGASSWKRLADFCLCMVAGKLSRRNLPNVHVHCRRC